ncbi:MAG: molybdopterin-dependent oxidoreductase [Geobacteraceae bacterium]|nr:molybdopterin-dependent oxidoreductase [Geobacteraceae bacterium]NTW78907.1 molybdopterin-dependent oxidoreductase [Geobacteraceae bacterium]
MSHTEPSDKKSTATLTINGKQVTVPVGTTILEAAAELGIKIPTLCWLKKVSTTGACRVCVVNVEGVERPMTACNTPVKDGIVVVTSTPELEAIRKKTMELMLVNHPLDCPVCDAAGECDLQDTCYGLQVDKTKYTAELERLPIRYDWKLLESDPNRCILCEKCVKVCREVVGREAIEIVDRGDRTIIDTISGEPLDCDFCGNCIGACPTGTLISKPFKFRGRPWTFEVTKSVCSFCSSGCEIEYHAGNGRVERVTSSDDSYNKGNLCINGRFGYAAFNAPDRIKSPLMKDGAGQLQKASWDHALGTVAAGLKDIAAASGGAAIAGIGSPRVTNEESYLFQKFLRGALGSNNIDSEARLGYLPAQVIQWEMLGYSGGTFGMENIEKATAIIVIGADLKAESAGFAYRTIQAATKNNAKLVMAGSRASSMNKFANAFLQCRPGSEAWLIAGLNKAVLAEGVASSANVTNLETLKSSLDALSFERINEISGVSEAQLRETAALICSGERTAVIYGADIIRSADIKNAVAGVVNLALLTGAVTETGAGIYPLDEKNNTQGMLDMGVCPEYLPGYHTYEHAAGTFSSAWKAVIPTVAGKDLFQIIDAIEAGQIKALYVMGSDPLHYLPNRSRVLAALQKLELLVVQDQFLTDTARLAHVILPAATGAEKSGSFTSADNRVQCFTAAVKPAGDTRTDADILTSLHSMIVPGAADAPNSLDALQHEITTMTGLYSQVCDHDGCRMGRIKNRTATFVAVPLAPLAPSAASRPFALTIGPVQHHNGSITTRSENNLLVAGEAYVELSCQDAASIGVTAGDMLKITSDSGSVSLKARLSEQLQSNSLFVPAHFREAAVNSLTGSASFPQYVSISKG